jgi:hypothetical protein
MVEKWITPVGMQIVQLAAKHICRDNPHSTNENHGEMKN